MIASEFALRKESLDKSNQQSSRESEGRVVREGKDSPILHAGVDEEPHIVKLGKELQVCARGRVAISSFRLLDLSFRESILHPVTASGQSLDLSIETRGENADVLEEGRDAWTALRIFERTSAVELGVPADVDTPSCEVEGIVGGRRADVLAGFGSGSGREEDEEDDGLFNSLRLKLEKTDPVLLEIVGDALVVLEED